MNQNGSVCVRLMGGLGNQLFQYASALAIAREDQRAVSVDPSKLKGSFSGRLNSHTKRSLDLEYFTPKVHQLSERTLLVSTLVQRTFALRKKVCSPEKGFFFNSKLLGYRYCDNWTGLGHSSAADVWGAGTKPRFLYMDGYWQDYRLFHPIRDELIAIFKPICIDIQKHARKSLDDLRNLTGNEIVSLHIRRGDYTNINSGFKSVDIKKIHSAVNGFSSKYSFAVFSDNIQWCKSHFKDTRYHFMDTGSAIGDLFAMTLCDHHIIANSTFSWWGAYLGSGSNKIVYAPDTWFEQDRADWQSRLILPEWHTY